MPAASFTRAGTGVTTRVPIEHNQVDGATAGHRCDDQQAENGRESPPWVAAVALAAWRTPAQGTFAAANTCHGDSLRRTLEDSIFPLEHLTLETVELAA